MQKLKISKKITGAQYIQIFKFSNNKYLYTINFNQCVSNINRWCRILCKFNNISMQMEIFGIVSDGQ